MDPRSLAATYAALADVTRLRILNLLGEGELCVCDLMAVLREPQSKVSRHLSYLRRAGLVSARKDGLWMHYRLAAQRQDVTTHLLKSLKRLRSEGTFRNDLRALGRNRGCLVACCD